MWSSISIGLVPVCCARARRTNPAPLATLVLIGRSTIGHAAGTGGSNMWETFSGHLGPPFPQSRPGCENRPAETVTQRGLGQFECHGFAVAQAWPRASLSSSSSSLPAATV